MKKTKPSFELTVILLLTGVILWAAFLGYFVQVPGA
jgi:hypothetical protein